MKVYNTKYTNHTLNIGIENGCCNLPNRDKTPPSDQTMRSRPTDPVFRRTEVGVIKIPEPVDIRHIHACE